MYIYMYIYIYIYYVTESITRKKSRHVHPYNQILKKPIQAIKQKKHTNEKIPIEETAQKTESNCQKSPPANSPIPDPDYIDINPDLNLSSDEEIEEETKQLNTLLENDDNINNPNTDIKRTPWKSESRTSISSTLSDSSSSTTDNEQPPKVKSVISKPPQSTTIVEEYQPKPLKGEIPHHPIYNPQPQRTNRIPPYQPKGFAPISEIMFDLYHMVNRLNQSVGRAMHHAMLRKGLIRFNKHGSRRDH